LERVRYLGPVPTLLLLAPGPRPEQHPPAARAPELLILKPGTLGGSAASTRKRKSDAGQLIPRCSQLWDDARDCYVDSQEVHMAVLMTAQLPGGTQEMIDGMRPLLDPIRHTKGFVVHANGPVPGGWRVTEVWDSQADFEAWFESNIKPAFPEGGPQPSITIDELNEVVTSA
jgi:quinol monooxygenase YgiN